MAHPARSLASIPVVYLLSLILVPNTFSQSPEQRASIAAFRDSLGAVADLTALQELRARARANRAGHANRLRLGCILHRLGELTRQRQPLDDGLLEFAEVAPAEPDWPEGWDGLAHGHIEREAGNGRSALAAFDRFLQLGGDSAVGLLERARTLSLLRRAGEAQEAYFAAASRARSIASVAHLRSDLAWIATREELARFDSTSQATRVSWLKAFWARKDALDARAPGERLAEHYRRLSYTMRHFR